MPYTPNFMNPAYSQQPTMPPNPYQYNPMQMFLNGFMGSFMPILQYKMKTDMENESWMQREKMVREWEAQHPNPDQIEAQAKADFLTSLSPSDRNAYFMNGGKMPKVEQESGTDLLNRKKAEWFDRMASGGGGGSSDLNDYPAAIGAVGKSVADEMYRDALAERADTETTAKAEAETANRGVALGAAARTATAAGSFPNYGESGGFKYDFKPEQKINNDLLAEFINRGLSPGITPDSAPAAMTTRARQKIAEYAAGQGPLPTEVASNREWWEAQDEKKAQDSKLKNAIVYRKAIEKAFPDKPKTKGGKPTKYTEGHMSDIVKTVLSNFPGMKWKDPFITGGKSIIDDRMVDMPALQSYLSEELRKAYFGEGAWKGRGLLEKYGPDDAAMMVDRMESMLTGDYSVPMGQ